MKHSTGFADLRMSVPCGQCLGCKIEKSRQWAIRITQEAQMHKQSMFLTLTYDEYNLPMDKSIHKEHIQKFIHDLRQYLSRKKLPKIRYFACGEYGDLTQRPHYHMILFNYWPPDTKFYKKQPKGTLFTSKIIDELWDKGNCSHGEVNFDTAQYTASYVTKKITGDQAWDHYQWRQPEFALMSRRPGIGHAWLQKFGKETWAYDSIVMNGKELQPPRYYTNQLELTDSEKHRTIKLKRKIQGKKHIETDEARLWKMELVQKLKMKHFQKESI